MLLRSSEELKSEEADSDCCLENRDAVEENEVSLNCGFEPSLNGVAEKRGNEVEDMGCVAKATHDFKLRMGENHIASEDEKESRNSNVTLLPSGSMVAVCMESLDASTPEKQIAKKGVACDLVECVTVSVKAEQVSAPVNLSLLEAGSTDKIKSSPVVVADAVSVPNSPHKGDLRCENLSEYGEPESFVNECVALKSISGDEDKKSSSVVVKNCFNETSSDVDFAKEKMQVDEKTVSLNVDKKASNDSSNAENENFKGVPAVEKSKRGRKRKVVESADCTRDTSPSKVKVEEGGVAVNGRVLRSRITRMSGNVKVEESRINESVIGFKRQMEAECLDQTELPKEASEISRMAGRCQKKQKRRGRPPKLQGAAGFKRKMKDEILDRNDIHKEVNESGQLTGRLEKKERRGRPPKVQGEELVLQEIWKKEHQEVNESGQLEKKERRGRPPKVQGEELASQEIQKKEHKEVHKEVNESDQLTGRLEKKERRGRPPKVHDEEPVLQEIQKKEHKGTVSKNLKGRGRPPKLQAGNLSTQAKESSLKDVKLGPNICHVQIDDQSSEITGDNKKKVTISDKSNGQTTAEDSVKDHNTNKLKNGIGGSERREIQQSVRDKIVSMIVKAGWTIEHRQRQQREYRDAVYVDQNGKTHWSITKAYFCLKKKIENGVATSEEVIAFTPIPDEEMSVLFRSVSKVRSDKNKKKNKKRMDVCKAEIVIRGEAQLKKKPGKKRKDVTKRKEIQNSAVKLANKPLNVKVKKYKSRHENVVIAESSLQRRPKVSQKGRQSRKPCLVARTSTKDLDQDNDDCTIYTRKRNLLSWMIDSGVIIPGSKLQYGEGRRRSGLPEGTVTCDGIRCSCCNEVMDISKFVSHHGQKLDHALKNICIQSGGSSLLMCLLESWKKEVESADIRFNFVDIKGDDPNDDTCNICGDGGNLICCDSCPSTFHQSCLDIQSFPSGDWHCIHCSCKFCGLVAGGISHKDDSYHAPDLEMLTCCLCEEKFHHSCLQEEDAVIVGSSSLSFCGRKCQELYEQLQTYIGVKFELKEGYSWTLLKRFDVSQDLTVLDDPVKVECNSKLAVAFSVMNECFVPIMDERSGVNRIHNVVYNCGSNFRRLNYSGFCTAILEKGGELISAASIRIHGDRLAEMPFIGTRNMYRRQGMCRRLLDAIEHALGSLGVGELVIPAIPELYKTWTKVFGFKPLEESSRQAMKSMSMIVFPGTDMLQKPLFKSQFADKNLIVAVADDKPMEYISAVKEDIPLQSETKSSNAIDYEPRPATTLESETPTTSFHDPERDSDIRSPSSDENAAREHKVIDLVNGSDKTSPLISKAVPKNTFDLNLQPAVFDTDIQSIDNESISRDPQVCKNSFDLPESRDQVENNATPPLVLV